MEKKICPYAHLITDRRRAFCDWKPQSDGLNRKPVDSIGNGVFVVRIPDKAKVTSADDIRGWVDATVICTTDGEDYGKCSVNRDMPERSYQRTVVQTEYSECTGYGGRVERVVSSVKVSYGKERIKENKKKLFFWGD